MENKPDWIAEKPEIVSVLYTVHTGMGQGGEGQGWEGRMISGAGMGGEDDGRGRDGRGG